MDFHFISLYNWLVKLFCSFCPRFFFFSSYLKHTNEKKRHFYGFTFDILSIIFGITFSFCFCVRTLSQCPLLTLQRKKKRIIWSIRIISSWQLGTRYIPSIFFSAPKKFISQNCYLLHEYMVEVFLNYFVSEDKKFGINYTCEVKLI